MNRRTLLTGLAGGLAATVAGCHTGPAYAVTYPAPAPLRLPYYPRVLLMGDSYTEGYGAVPLTEGYAYKIAAPLGWNLTRDGIGGTGYVNVGPATTKVKGRYADRLWRHQSSTYDLVILQGGSNDEKYTNAEFVGSVNMTVRTVQRLFPTARILIFGPTTPYGSPSVDRARINTKLKTHAAEHSLPFVDAIAERWFVPGDGTSYANPANGHPNNAGYDLIAQRLVQDVEAL